MLSCRSIVGRHFFCHNRATPFLRAAMKKALVLPLLAVVASQAAAFSFSEDEQQQKDAEAASRHRVAAQLATPCKQAIKDKRIMVILGERTGARNELRPGKLRPPVHGHRQAPQAAGPEHPDPGRNEGQGGPGRNRRLPEERHGRRHECVQEDIRRFHPTRGSFPAVRP